MALRGFAFSLRKCFTDASATIKSDIVAAAAAEYNDLRPRMYATRWDTSAPSEWARNQGVIGFLRALKQFARGDAIKGKWYYNGEEDMMRHSRAIGDLNDALQGLARPCRLLLRGSCHRSWYPQPWPAA